jgi:TolB protein
MERRRILYRVLLRMFVGLFIWLITLFPGNQACFAKVYIDIDSPSFQRFPIAIQDFMNTGNGQTEDLSSWFPDALANYLSMTGYFNIISKQAFLENENQSNTPNGRIDFGAWTTIGAEYLVRGRYHYNKGGMVAEFFLYDVVKGDLITGKQYTGKPEEKRDMVRRFAREILISLTGDGSVFDSKIALVLKKGNPSDIYVINFDGSNLIRVTDEKTITLSPRWSPDEQYISYTSYRDGNPDLYLKSLNGNTRKKIAGFAGINISGTWSLDGSKLLLTSRKDGNEELYVMELKNGNLKRLTYHLAIDVSPAWSPDNRKIAFVSNRSGSPQIYVMDSDGSNVRRLTYNGNYNTSPSWSPNGKRIIYEGSINGNFQIVSIGEDGTDNTQLTFDQMDHVSPSWSPDGRYFVFCTKQGAKSAVYIMNVNGLNLRLLYEGNGSPIASIWSPRLKR